MLTDHAPALSTIPWEAAKHGYRASIERVGSPEWLITLAPAVGADARPSWSPTWASSSRPSAPRRRASVALGAVQLLDDGMAGKIINPLLTANPPSH